MILVIAGDSWRTDLPWYLYSCFCPRSCLQMLLRSFNIWKTKVLKTRQLMMNFAVPSTELLSKNENVSKFSQKSQKLLLINVWLYLKLIVSFHSFLFLVCPPCIAMFDILYLTLLCGHEQHYHVARLFCHLLCTPLHYEMLSFSLPVLKKNQIYFIEYSHIARQRT